MNYASPYLGKIIKVKIDRPLGSKHPKHGFEYLVNYGFLPGVIAPDGEELDAYILGVNHPLKEFTGKCIAIIHRLDDDDDKLVVASENIEFSNEQIEQATAFQEKFFQSVIIR